MATFTNQAKNNTSFTNKNISGIAKWNDSAATWGDTIYNWAAQKTQFTNQAKNNTSFTNQTKN